MRIFLSYGHDEFSELANKLKIDLTSRGHDVWFDIERIKPGADFEEYIEDGINWVSEKIGESKIILLMTPHSVRRPEGYCLNELARGTSRKIPLIPIMVVWCEPPLSICRIQWLDMQDCVPLDRAGMHYEQKFERLIDALENNKLDFEGNQSKLITYLEPFRYDTEITRHLNDFTGRKWIFEEIDEWLNKKDSEKIFFLFGGPGSGKSAISAWLSHNRKEIVALHFFSNPNLFRSDPRRCILSIVYQLTTQLPSYQDKILYLPFEDIVRITNSRTLFQELIVSPLSKNFPDPGKVLVILIDGLDEVKGAGYEDIVAILTNDIKNLPGWLKFIVTSRPGGNILSSFKKYPHIIIDEAHSKNDNDIEDFIRNSLKDFYEDEKSNEDLFFKILKKTSGNFLYAKWIVQEIINGDLNRDDIPALPSDLSGTYTDYMGRNFGASKNNQNQWTLEFYKEYSRPMLEVLSAINEPPDISYMQLVLGVDEYTIYEILDSLDALVKLQDDLLEFFHWSFREWITDRSNSGKYYASEMEGHKKISDYIWSEFNQGASRMTDYSIRYLPYHLIKSKRSHNFISLMTDSAYLAKIWAINEHEVKKILSLAERELNLSVSQLYEPVLKNPDLYPAEFIHCLGNLLYDLGYINQSRDLLSYLVLHYQKEGENPSLMNAMGNLGGLHLLSGNLNRAKELFEDEFHLCKKLNYLPGLQMSLGFLGNISYLMKDFDTANQLFEEQRLLCQKMGDPYWIQNSEGNIGNILLERGEFNDSLDCFKRQETICRDINNEPGLCIALGNEGIAYQKMQDYEKASQFFSYQKDQAECIGYKNGIQLALENQGVLAFEQNDLDQAISYLEQQETICRVIGNNDSLIKCLYNMSLIHECRKDPLKGLDLCTEMELISSKLQNPWIDQNILGRRGELFLRLGEMSRALECFNNQSQICEQIGDVFDLQRAIGYQGLIYEFKGNWARALNCYERKEQLCRKIMDKFGLQFALRNRGDIYFKRSDYNGALQLYEESESISLKLDNLCEQLFAIASQANVHQDMGRWSDAQMLYEKALDLSLKLSDLTSYRRYSAVMNMLLFKMGKFSEYRKKLDKETPLCMILNEYDSIYLLNFKKQVMNLLLGDIQELSAPNQITSPDISDEALDRWLSVIYLNQECIHEIQHELSQFIEFLVEDQFLDQLGIESYSVQHAALSSQLEIPVNLQKFYQKIGELTSKLEFTMGSQFVSNQLGLFNYFSGNVLESIDFFKKQESLCRNIGYPGGEMESKGFLAQAYIALGKWDNSLELLEIQEKFCVDHGILELLAKNLYYQAKILHLQGRNDEALDHLNAHLDVCKEIGFISFLPFSLGLKGIILQMSGKPQESKDIFKKMLEICNQMEYAKGKRLARNHMDIGNDHRMSL